MEIRYLNTFEDLGLSDLPRSCGKLVAKQGIESRSREPHASSLITGIIFLHIFLWCEGRGGISTVLISTIFSLLFLPQERLDSGPTEVNRNLSMGLKRT